MIFHPYKALVLLVLAVHALAVNASTADQKSALTLNNAERQALSNEPGAQALQLKASALASEAVAAAQLPDPKLQVSLDNLPTDGFKFDQEPMTQFKIALSQQIPATGALEAQSGIRKEQSQAASNQAMDRQLQVLRQVREEWLELYYWQQAKEVVSTSKTVFKQLLAVVNSLYKVGRKNQHDLLRAELELSRLDDRLIDIDDEIARQRARLSQWIGDDANRSIASELPQWQLANNIDAQLLQQHPAMMALDRQVEARQRHIALAESSYRPNWGVNVSYGHRQEDFTGRDLPDFFSAGVTVQLPLFTDKRQDQKYRASVDQHQAALSDRQQNLLALRSQLDNHLSNARHLKQRFELFQQTILVQAGQQADSALKAYRSDAADFDEVMRSVLAELSAQLENQRLQINYFKSLARVRYLVDFNEIKEIAQ
ncbi:TolC family protein [Porticoccaceae bacterium LTM1]|nr:TolC family protein [Porticoccaceae bacterium LTM1]